VGFLPLPSGLNPNFQPFPQPAGALVASFPSFLTGGVPTPLSATIAPATIGSPYTATIQLTGGQGPPYTYTITAGSLPPGITINTSTGQLSGTATSPGSYTFEITVTDSKNGKGKGTFNITVSSATTVPPNSGFLS